MNIVLCADGHIGSVVAKELLKTGAQVTVVLHSDKRAEESKKQGANVAVCEINDTSSLHQVFKGAEQAFVLNPTAPISKDTVQMERKSAISIVKALEESGIKRVVAQSTYGAQPGDSIGDLGVLYEFEQELTKLNTEITIVRGAYYMTNWDMNLETAQTKGVVYTFYPPSFLLPMVAPADLGHLNALLLSSPSENKLVYAEGPQHYSSDDVAHAFSLALNKPVKVVEIPEDKWMGALQSVGFSEASAKSMVNMTKITKEKCEKPSNPTRGNTTLNDYIKQLVNKNR